MKKVLLIIAVFAAIFSSGCAQIKETRDNLQGQEKSTVNKVKGDFNIDVMISFEGLAIDEVKDQVETYFRVRNSIYPAAATRVKKAGMLSFECQEISGNGYTGKFAKAPSSKNLTSEEIKELIYGNFTITPSTKLTTGFNEIDCYGNGNVEMILKIILKPPIMPGSKKEALELARNFFASRKITANYGISMVTEPGKALYAEIDFLIPDSAFESTPTFIGTYGL